MSYEEISKFGFRDNIYPNHLNMNMNNTFLQIPNMNT